MPYKQNASDPIPIWLLKECTSELAPFLCRLVDESLLAGVVPAAFKSAYICPLIKKPDLNPAEVKNYRPISNLTVLSKLPEKLVTRQLIDYLSDNNCYPTVNPPTGPSGLLRPLSPDCCLTSCLPSTQAT